MITIKNRWTGAVIATGNTWAAAVATAIAEGKSLYEADLTGANLTGAVLTGANLTGAVLTGANLTDADLTGANLTDADLTPIRDDIYEILNRTPEEVGGLLTRIRDGRVDGSTYVGSCACLVGTVAAVARGKAYESTGESTGDVAVFANKRGFAIDSKRPAERFFMGIREGDTPATNQVSAIVETWILQWFRARGTAAAILSHQVPR